MPNEKKLRRLEALLDTFDEGAVQPDELIRAIDAVMAVIDQNGKTLVDTIVKNKALSDSDISQLKADIKAAQASLKALVSEVKANADTSLSSVKTALLNEIKRVESAIPVLPPETDLSEVFAHIEDMRGGMSKLSELILGENVRNSLEVLQGEDRLDKSAIRGLDDYEEVAQLAREKSSGAKGWASSIAEIRAGSGISVDRTDLRRPIISVTATPSSLTVETPTGTVDASNASFTVTAEPLWVVSDGIIYFNGAGYTYAALSITMEVPPSQFIRAII